MLPVLALPGILIGRRSWETVESRIRALGRAFIPFSFPGYDGRARLPQGTPTPLEYATRARAELDGPAHILAHCSGCNTAVALAAAFPGVVASVTLISYWHGTKEWESRKAATVMGVPAYADGKVKVVIDHPTREPDLPARLKGWIVDAMTDLEGFLQLSRSVCLHHTRSELEAVRCPVHFMIGLRDAVTLPAAMARIAMRKAGALATLLDCGHSAHWERPDEVIESCAPFWEASE